MKAKEFKNQDTSSPAYIWAQQQRKTKEDALNIWGEVVEKYPKVKAALDRLNDLGINLK